MTRYDEIGTTYSVGRRTDPRWMAAIDEALGDAETVVNVGAGTGSYEPADRRVVAVEPSWVMLAQRPVGAAPAVQARAESLPLPDRSFDAALAVLTVHHWDFWDAGVHELQRVAERQVPLVYDSRAVEDFWFVRDYLPGLTAFEQDRSPAFDLLLRALGQPPSRPLPVPRDMSDGVLAAYWARPAGYLDPEVRACMSALVQLPPAVVASAIEALRADLEDGTWSRRNHDLDRLDALDVGYRLLVSTDPSTGHGARNRSSAARGSIR